MARDNAETDSGAAIRHTARHRLDQVMFDELAAGGGGPATIAALWSSERSRRFVLLRALHDVLGKDPALLGPLPPLMHAWHALESAQDVAPQAVTDLLLSPGVGAWLSFAFRDRAGGDADAAAAFGTYGQVHALALVAASLAGQTFTTRVPLRDGQVFLPMRGLARFDVSDSWAVADAGTENHRMWLQYGDRRVEIPAERGIDVDGWFPLRQLRAEDAHAFTVWLDDLDPMRDLADPVPPARLSDDEVCRWQNLFDGAWAILSEHHAPIAESMLTGVTTLVPLPMSPGRETRSASSGDAFGAIICSPPPDPATLAVSLVHEFAHIRLGGLMHLLRLTEGGDTPCLYAPWRDDPRPLGGLIQGVYAFFAIADFWRRQRTAADGVDAALAEFEYAYSRAQAESGLATVRAADGLTGHGAAFTDRLAAELRTWTDDPFDGESASLARLVADSHRAGWRIRHCEPAADDVRTLITMWTNGSGASFAVKRSAVRPDPTMRQWSQARLGLARRRIVAPGQYIEIAGDGWGAGLADADLALFAGDGLAASKGFAEQIVENPDALDAWTGLGLALGAERHAPAGVALMTRPEVVLAVYREVAAETRHVAPIDVAAWLGRTILN